MRPPSTTASTSRPAEDRQQQCGRAATSPPSPPDPARRRAPLRRGRPAGRLARARRRHRQRQRRARRRPLRLRRRRHRLRPRPARPRPRARRGRGSRRSTCVEGDAEALPVRRRRVRRGALGVRRDVRARSGAHGGGARRACRPGGTIALANWTPTASSARCAVVGRHLAPPAGAPSPIRWGSESYLRELLGDRIEALVAKERTFTFRFRSAAAFVDYFRTFYGPTVKAFEAAGAAGGDPLFTDLVAGR